LKSGRVTTMAMAGMKHTNSSEGLWTGLRNFLRPFRGIHKRYLFDYVAIHEFRVNFKAISPVFIPAHVHRHSF
ncbi:MAG: hypothetical protein K8I82_14435, partial [Anaerolineae bacterium]|nr:hypothetical protein [Anaerolineae bacterium]